ncbi:hypothetical protein HPP92_025517 [Vanilla planifolia]|uniref:Uncharacterized protein n=1 Tax=Vanilla planifolia TaxID=51239 RepID=A0A835PK58_VANPL|nr:hypothetical protein HPP92_025517 [Vanilla planifolia]
MQSIHCVVALPKHIGELEVSKGMDLHPSIKKLGTNLISRKVSEKALVICKKPDSTHILMNDGKQEGQNNYSKEQKEASPQTQVRRQVLEQLWQTIPTLNRHN